MSDTQATEDEAQAKEALALESDIKSDLAMMLSYSAKLNEAQRLYEEHHRSFSSKLYRLVRLAGGKR